MERQWLVLFVALASLSTSVASGTRTPRSMSSSAASEWGHSYCIGQSWDTTRFEKLAFRSYTPCVVDAGIVALAHATFLVGLAWRLWQLRHGHRVAFASKLVQVLTVFLLYTCLNIFDRWYLENG